MTSEVAHKFIVVEGPIGVGKTSLARRLCESLSAQGVFEQAAQNPFLERFYRNPRAGALPAQLYFLLQRAQQLASLNQADLFAPVRVADYLLEKGRVAVVPGITRWFGPGSEGHIRIPFATSHEIMREGLDRIENALRAL